MQAAQKLKQTGEAESDPVDRHVGGRLRQRRLMLGFTQEKLGNFLGMSFQQVQKYERGQNRVSASRLYEVARILQVPITYFFENAPVPLEVQPGMGEQEQEAFENAAAAEPHYASRETSELLRAYYRIEDAKKRRRVLDLIRAMNGDD